MAALTSALRHTGAYALFFYDCMVSSARHGVRWPRVIDEAYKLGVRALPVLAVMAIFVGTNLAIQGYTAFSKLGAGSLLGMFVALAGIREVCPILAATMIAAKGGTEMTAQLAVMRTREQIEALDVMAVDPRAELVTPSLIAIMIVLPALTVISIALSLGAAFGVAVFQLHVGAGDFLYHCMGNFKMYDLWVAVIKSMGFGAVIATVSGYFGFFSERGPAGVGRATNRAVVTMCVVCICLNFLLSAVAYG